MFAMQDVMIPGEKGLNPTPHNQQDLGGIGESAPLGSVENLRFKLLLLGLRSTAYLHISSAGLFILDTLIQILSRICLIRAIESY